MRPDATAESAPIERLTVSAREAARMLGVSERTIYQLTKIGKIPSKKIGARVIYPIDGLRNFVNDAEPISTENPNPS